MATQKPNPSAPAPPRAEHIPPAPPPAVSYSAQFVRLKKSLFDEGPRPEYHRTRIRLMKKECPEVWAAIVSLIGTEPDWCRDV